MIIVRNGEEYALTDWELTTAFLERLRDIMIANVKKTLVEMVNLALEDRNEERFCALVSIQNDEDAISLIENRAIAYRESSALSVTAASRMTINEYVTSRSYGGLWEQDAVWEDIYHL